MATEQTQKMVTVTSKAAEKIQEFEYMFKVAVVPVYHMEWVLKKHQKKMTLS
jgi:hypothetical protein